MLLVAAPTLLDPNFVDTVVLLLDADDEGAIGVVLNRPTPVPVEEVLPDWGPVVAEPEVLFQGGPVSTEGALAVALLEDGVVVPDAGFRPVAGPFGLVDLDRPAGSPAYASSPGTPGGEPVSWRRRSRRAPGTSCPPRPAT
jgi:putative transcriptional regulator